MEFKEKSVLRLSGAKASGKTQFALHLKEKGIAGFVDASKFKDAGIVDQVASLPVQEIVFIDNYRGNRKSLADAIHNMPSGSNLVIFTSLEERKPKEGKTKKEKNG